MEPYRIKELEAEARHARQRYDLYRAKMYGPRPTDPSELRELQRVAESAAERLRHARTQAGDPPAGREPPGRAT